MFVWRFLRGHRRASRALARDDGLHDLGGAVADLEAEHVANLNNPKPGYPAISKRMGEQGKVVLRVLIGTDGLPQKVEINQSSGYDRLDRQAQEAVMRWRFVPGKRNGVPDAMWSLVPINFVLE